MCLAEAAAGAGEPWQVERLYALLAPYADANPVLEHVWAIWGPAARALGLLAAADDRPQDAAAHFADGGAAGAGVGLAGLGAALDRRLAGHRRPGAASARSSSAAAWPLARELALPGVAARIADEAQTITP